MTGFSGFAAFAVIALFFDSARGRFGCKYSLSIVNVPVCNSNQSDI
jgi:hypothetical protein